MKNFFKKLRFSTRLIKAFFQKYQKLLILGFLIGSVVFLLFPSFLRHLTSRKTQTIALVGKFTEKNLPDSIQSLISNGLTKVTPDGQVKPQLAKSWQIGEDAKEYTFTLNEDLFWHDGTPVVAKDINYGFSDAVTVFLDNYQIKFVLKEPFAPFPLIVSRAVFKNKLIGTGEYKVVKIKKRGEIVEKISLQSVKDKKRPKLVFRFYPNEKAAITAFKLGEVNIFKDISNPNEFLDWKNVQIIPEVKNDRFVGIFFNTQEEKLTDKSRRQALAYAIDKHWQPRALSSYNPYSWAYNRNVKTYDYDLKKAKTLLEKSQNKEEEKSLQEIELSTIPSLLEVAEEIKEDWEKLNIATKIKVINNFDESFQALLIAQEIPADPDQYLFWHSTQATNISRLRSPKLNRLLEEGRKTLDLQKRKEIYFDFQKSLVEETPAVFLFHPTVYTLSRK